MKSWTSNCKFERKIIALTLSLTSVQQQTATKTVIRTIPSSIISMAKAGTAGLTTTQGGGKTIVIAAPKGSQGNLTTPTKIITSMPKLAGQGNTQFIVVSPQGSNVMTPGVTTLAASALGEGLFFMMML